jgi:SNF2 family DNA or RNA helicase
MRDYQLVGMSWMLSRFEQSANVILGDEMGLGKTLQTIATMAHLKFVDGVRAPFCTSFGLHYLGDCIEVVNGHCFGAAVVVCPLTVLGNWLNELSTFCPKLKAIKYSGSSDERETIREEIVAHIKSQPRSQWVRIAPCVTASLL